MDRNAEVNKKLLKAARILERMVNQVILSMILSKLRVWELILHILYIYEALTMTSEYIHL